MKKVASETQNHGRNYWSWLQKPLSDKNLLFLSQKFTYGHHPTGPTPHDLFKTRNEVQSGLMAADTGGDVRVGGEVDKDEYEEDSSWDGIAEHVHLNVTLNQQFVLLRNCSIY